MARAYLAELTRHVGAAPAVVWGAIERTGDYPTWWPWLRAFEHDGGLAQGATWRASVRAPLPYTVSFDVALVHVDAASHTVHAAVGGDVTGSATVALAPSGTGTVLRTTWRLTPRRRLLRALDVVAPRVARWGHDTVMRRSVAAFVAAVEQTRPPWRSTSR